MASTTVPEPCVMVIFGASGDLTHRKLIPSLYDLDRQGFLPEGLTVIGVARTPMTDAQFREKMQPSVQKFSAHFEPGAWPNFAKRLHYHPMDAAQLDGYTALAERIHSLAQERGI